MEHDLLHKNNAILHKALFEGFWDVYQTIHLKEDKTIVYWHPCVY